MSQDLVSLSGGSSVCFLTPHGSCQTGDNEFLCYIKGVVHIEGRTIELDSMFVMPV